MNEDANVPGPVKAALQFLRLCDIIRCPPRVREFDAEGRDLTDREQAAENAELDMLRDYFISCRAALRKA